MPTAVYIWYPHEGHIGHCSMHIGNHREASSDEYYISWWPHKSTVLKTRQGVTSTYSEDKDTEGGPPHVKYLLYDTAANINCATMKAEWDAIKGKEDAHYKLLAKNCSTTVARVLKAGGLKELLGKEWSKYGKHTIWTPRDVAKLCERLVAQDLGRKEKHHDCPLRSQSIRHVIMGLR